ncbi:MAG: hypothetical protein VYE73_04525 [Acidobacteriota bacterium]|nr:hypothetical protein [Acidobacteriota bacterium]
MPAPAPLLAVLLVVAQVPEDTVADPEILGTPADWSIRGVAATRPTLELPAATKVFEEPSSGSTVVMTFAGGRVPVWTTRLGWAQILVGDSVGWVEIEPTGELEVRPFPPEPAQAPPPVPYPDPELVAAARQQLSPQATHTRAGGLELHIDADDRKLVATFVTIAQQMATVYRNRYGIGSDHDLTGVVFAFVDAAAFDAARTQILSTEARSLAGVASGGVAIVHIDRLRSPQVPRTFLHELAHLWNHHLFGGEVPVWLEEGIAEDLALSTMTSDGKINTERVAKQVHRDGPLTIVPATTAIIATLTRQAQRDELTSSAELLEMDQASFMSSDRRLSHYVQSGLLVRFLLEERDFAATFRTFLAQVAAGGNASGSHLLDALGKIDAISSLDRRFRDWVLDLRVPVDWARP